MVQGIEVDLFRPDDELKQLARLAVERGVDVSRGLEAVTDEAWLAAWEAAKDPWFNFSSGSGMYSTDKVWLDHLEIPFGFVAGYVEELRAGKDIARPTAAIARRARPHHERVPRAAAGGRRRRPFDAKLGLSRLVFPYVENHNFYIEHWSLSVFWRRVRELGQVLADAGFWAEADDIFLLRRDEVPQAIFDYGNGWAVGVECAGPYHWPAELERRKRILAALGTKPPLPAMNEPPAVVTEPFTIMLYGITSERVGQWLSGGDSDGGLRGMAASPGTVEGVARVVLDAGELAAIQPGEILVSRITAPSWGPVFSQISAVVTDIGGMMSHAAIVCREYGLPAVTGTGSATTAIQTGQRIRVEGDSGTVTLLS